MDQEESPSTPRRRHLIALLGSAIIGWPLAAAARLARAQGPAQRRIAIAILGPLAAEKITESAGVPYPRAFFEELRRLGHVEGRNLIVERYSAEGKPERFADIAPQMVNRNPDLIVVATNPFAREIQAAAPQAGRAAIAAARAPHEARLTLPPL